MLSYQHGYHAGNFADVHKHALLIFLMTALKNRSQSLPILDTHAGRGLYDLSDPQSQKTKEYQNGIGQIWESLPTPLNDYLQTIQNWNTEAALNTYPGSPALLQHMLRPEDTLHLSELHPAEFEALKKNIPYSERIHISQENGLHALIKHAQDHKHAQSGLCVIDPSYERKEDFSDVPKAIRRAQKLWPRATFFIWFPLLRSMSHTHMIQNLKQLDSCFISQVAFPDTPDEGFSMYGSGVALISAPLPRGVLTGKTQDIAAALGAEAVV